MRLLIASTLIPLAAAGAAAAQQTAPAEPLVHVGLFNYGQDGRVMGYASANDRNGLVSHVWTNRNACQVGAGSRTPPDAATDAWEFSTRMISADGESAVIQLDWRKSIDEGKPVTGTNTTQQLTLTRGQPVVLDSITPLAPCSSTAVVLEARYDVRRFDNPQMRGGGGGGARSGAIGTGAGGAGGGGAYSGAGGAGAGGRGRVSGSGGGVGTGSGTGSGSGSGGADRSQELSEKLAAIKARALELNLLKVELWLVHSAPGRDDEVSHTTLRMTRGGAAFAFAPVTILSATGTPAIVQVTGSIRVTRSEAGEEQLTFITMRRLTLASAATPRDSTVIGSSTTSHPMPGPEEVLSFEMPALQTLNGGTLPDRFSVRVRIAPAQQE